MKRFLLLLLLLPLFVSSQEIPDKPSTYVTDEANVLSGDDEKALNHKLRLFKDSTSNQICVYITDSLKGRDMTLLCQQIFDKWDIGQKDKDNGVLIAVFVSDHKFRIHTGYGLEGALPDVLTKRIQDEYMRPAFKLDDYNLGINRGVDQLIYYSKHEYTPDSSDASVSEGSSVGGYIVAYSISAVLFLLNFLLIRFLFKGNKTLKNIFWSIAGAFCLIPMIGIVFLALTLIISGIAALIKLAGRSSGSYSGSSTTREREDYSWSSSSSSSDSDYSSSSSSDDSYSGGGGDSGGGGSNSDW